MLRKIKEDQGSLVLDTALVIPLIIIICYFMLSSILTVQHEIVMRYALDQTAKELSLLIPLAEGVYSEIEHSKVDEIIEQIMPGSSTEFKQSAGDLASSIFLQDFLQKQIDRWLNDSADRLKIRIPPDERQIVLATVSDHNLQLKINYHIQTPWLKTKKQAISYVPVWTKYDSAYQPKTENEEKDEQDTDNIWSEHNFVRGKYFREMYDANLPFNYPVICCYQNGEVLAVRSIDLTAPSYADSKQLIMQIEQEINNLAMFKGSERSTDLAISKITATDISTRRLVIVIPGNSEYEVSQNIFLDLINTASNSGVELEFTVQGNSYRYKEKPTLQNSADDS